MNYQIIKIPALRRNIFTNINLDIINDNINKVFKFKDLVYVDQNGIHRLKLTIPEIGYYYDMSVQEFVNMYIFGSLNVKIFDSVIDYDNFDKSIINGKKMTKAFQFRMENLLRQTKYEQMFWNYIFENRYSKKLRKISKYNNFLGKKKGFKITQQAILPVEDSFYIADFALFIPGYPVLIIELDGSYHFEDTQIEYDKERSRKLIENYGITILRFQNKELLDFDSVFDKIINYYKQSFKFNPDIVYFKCKEELIKFLHLNYDILNFSNFEICYFNNLFYVKCFNEFLSIKDKDKDKYNKIKFYSKKFIKFDLFDFVKFYT